MKRRWALTVETAGPLLLLSSPTLASATLTNAGVLILRDGRMGRGMQARQGVAGAVAREGVRLGREPGMVDAGKAGAVGGGRANQCSGNRCRL